MNKPHTCLCASLLLFAPAYSHAEDIFPADLVVERLDNDLQVVIVPLDVPLVTVQTWVAVGARNEVLEGTTGYAHFFEHLMFRGSKEYAPAARQEALLRAGAVGNAWTSEDRTNYHLTVRADRLAAILDLESDRFKNLALTEDAVRQEAGAVMGEFRKDRSDPDTALYETLYATAFQVHPYRHATIGLEADVMGMAEGYTIAQRFYQTHYRPERITVVIAGGVEPGAALEMVRERYGGWDPPAVSVSAIPVEPEQTAPRRETVSWPGEAGTRLAVGWRVPGFSPTETESVSLVLARSLLAARAAPLHRRLVQEKSMAWSMWSESPDRIDPGLLALFVELRDGVSVEQVEAEIAAAVSDLKQISPEALDIARARARRQLLLSLDDPQSWAYQAGRFAAYTGDPRAMERYLDVLAGLTVEEFRRVVAARLQPTGQTTIVLEGEGS